MLKNLLEYQKLDGKILSLKRGFQNDAANQTLKKVQALKKESQSKLLELDEKAKSALQEFEKNKKEYEKGVEELNKLVKQDDPDLTEDQMNKNMAKANQLVSFLGQLERTVSSQADNVSSISEQAKLLSNSIRQYQQKEKELKQQVANLEENLKPQLEEIKQQKAKLEKDIDANLLNKYKHIRQDKIFPVFVPLNNSSCGGCSMQLPAAFITKLKSAGYLECESCRRFIYLA